MIAHTKLIAVTAENPLPVSLVWCIGRRYGCRESLWSQPPRWDGPGEITQLKTPPPMRNPIAPVPATIDRLDSRGLALYALAVPLKPYPMKSAVTEQVDQLLAARRLLSSSIASL